jgi:hypothetical protein
VELLEKMVGILYPTLGFHDQHLFVKMDEYWQRAQAE